MNPSSQFSSLPHFFLFFHCGFNYNCIKGEVIYFDELSTIIVEVKEMNTLLSIRKKIDRNVDSVVGVVFHCNMIVDGIT